jgi:hypothetical protein
VIVAPSRLRVIRKAAALAKIKLTCDLSIEEKAAWRSGRILHWLIVKAELLKLQKSGQFPD